MADLGLVGNDLPLASAGFQDFFDGAVEWFVHSPILVKHSSNVKEHFTSYLRHPCCMSETTSSINQILAANLAHWMGQAKLTQAALADRAGVSQKTISNYLNPEQRTEGSTGKQPSAKLTELDRVAKALGIQVWQLTREMSAGELAMYESFVRAYTELRENAQKTGDVQHDGRHSAEPVAKAQQQRTKLQARNLIDGRQPARVRKRK